MTDVITRRQAFRRVDEAVTVLPGKQPEANTRYIFGVDWARGKHFTCIAVLDADRQRLVALDRFQESRWAPQRDRLLALQAHWKPYTIWAEANSIGGPNIEALQAEGLPVIPFTVTASSKERLIRSLALALDRGDLAILPDPILLSELHAYQVEQISTGHLRFGAPLGDYDDTVSALALAWYGAQQSGTGISFV